MKGQFSTDQGRVRNHNEDAGGLFINNANQYLSLIADGMGGHQAGDVASQMALSIIEKEWLETDEVTNPEEAEQWLKSIIHKVNTKIYEKSISQKECQGMGTTVVMTICTPDFITIAHVGDSRCYMINEKGFSQITEDHSLVNELVRSGQITHEDAEHHPRKNVILKALGTEEVIHPDIRTISWELGNMILLCSDGLSDKVSTSELQSFLENDKSIEETAQDFIALANERGGEDNISLVIVHHESDTKEGEPTC
ncbi:Stp1/IreP family PP2C-type Ser/Thr phosphatase [Virgibacillus necropolis]|uniref:protein-serine/threonine phosphatase n=1 Tax=Virgibacillus necropolis TaxID=163877 RepID=A0A221MDS4_9BACI|nr:Stp1/IreP family PP2C-type Ser/Thr phosphatase [Virgibacillus necropolis]ASN05816.1 protein phosphatase [Virgibacillus necropolis]